VLGVTNAVFIFRCLRRFKRKVQKTRSDIILRNSIFYSEIMLAFHISSNVEEGHYKMFIESTHLSCTYAEVPAGSIAW